MAYIWDERTVRTAVTWASGIFASLLVAGILAGAGWTIKAVLRHEAQMNSISYIQKDIKDMQGDTEAIKSSIQNIERFLIKETKYTGK